MPTDEEIQLQQEQDYKDKLIALGYKLDGSIDDWYKLMNNPAVFGVNWKSNAEYHFNEGIDFIQFCKNGNYIV